MAMSSPYEFDYTMIVTEQQQSLPQACSLVEAVVGAGVKINYPCFNCSRCDDYSEYLRQCKQLFANTMSFASPNLPVSTVGHVADNLLGVIDDANDDLVCSLHRPFPGRATTLIVEFDFDTMSVEHRAILEYLERAEPIPKSASVESVKKLVREKVKEEDGFDGDWCAVDCVICMEEIETRISSLKMPCSHLFHQDCLVEWLLDSSNVCPLCRYELPCEDRLA